MYAVAFWNVIGRDFVSVPLENVNLFQSILLKKPEGGALDGHEGWTQGIPTTALCS